MRTMGSTKYNYDGLVEVNKDGITVWKRKCPKCNKILHHKCKYSARQCYREKRVCSSCGSWNKGLTKDTNDKLKKLGSQHSTWLKEFRKSNPPWNKGLTKENNEILKYIGECRLGIPHTSETRKLIGAYTKKLWDNGYWGGRSTNEWHKYRNRVQFLTRKTVLQIPTYDPTKSGRCGVNGAYQIDHIIPIKYGFMNNIPPETISDPSNLQFIPWEENRKKGKSYDSKNQIQSSNN